ncbi:MAG TPA: Rieske 2Fe-2S domain-containing protein [Chloroflexota bacterium]|nr:Rieske 2Fe-2S domain-containing protein [Chloroflexota bacterium]
MLSPEENDLICRVRPGTPMGDVLRQYWLPLVLSHEVESDGPPLRVRLLGEDLVAFRDSDGQVGLLGDHCPHRGASLFFGRNQECGLRCVYHGWKFDRAGRCVDMPNEQPESNFKDKIHHTAYRCRERNGVVWTYMGPRSEPPELPSLEWNLVPEAQRHVTKRRQLSNWIQALEGGIDPCHTPFLHSSFKRAQADSPRSRFLQADKHPRYELLDTPYGMRIGTRRTIDEQHDFWSITHFLMPFYNAFSATDGQPDPTVGGFAWVPMDDTSTMAWCFSWNPVRPLTNDEIHETRARTLLGGGVHVGADELLPPTSEPGGAWRPIARAENEYLLDRAAQRSERFSAVPGISGQDFSLQESMGPMFDRSQEHLGSSDTAIIQARRCWLKAARELREHGRTPLGVDHPESYLARATGLIARRDDDWTKAGDGWITGRETTAPSLSIV